MWLADPNALCLPFLRVGLIEHSNRACLQVGWLLAEAHSNVESQDPTEWGWESMNEIDIHILDLHSTL